jgi:hypothetical protein
MTQLTPEQQEQVRQAKAAGEKRGFFGDVRRAIALSRRPVRELAAQIGVDSTLLSDFRAGGAELPSAVKGELYATRSPF